MTHLITRRNFVVSSATACCSCAMPPMAMAAEPPVQLLPAPDAASGYTAGCMVMPDDFRREKIAELGTHFIESTNAVFSGKRYRISASSGNRYFDRALAEALAHMSRTFGVLPTFGFIKDSQLANAFATTKRYVAEAGDAPLPVRKHGSVMFGDAMIASLGRKGIQDVAAAAIAICAHEFGHIVQFNYAFKTKNLMTLLLDKQPTVKRAELHADFLAGYYVGLARKRNPQTPAATVAQAVHALGDNNTKSRGHHGTPKERGQAVYAGYRVGYEMNRPFKEALVIGLKYVGAV